MRNFFWAIIIIAAVVIVAFIFSLNPTDNSIHLNPPHTEPLIPKWSLGYWQSGWGNGAEIGYGHRKDFIDHAKALRGLENQYGNHTYPADVMVLDMFWCDLNWDWPNNMNWSYTRFPDPEGMMKELHEMNYKLAINFHESGFGEEWLNKMKEILNWGLDIVWLDFWNKDPSDEIQIWKLLTEIRGNNTRIFYFARHYARPNKYNCEAIPYGNVGFDKPPFNDPIEKSMPMHWTGDQQGSWPGFMETIEGIVYGPDGAMNGWSYLHADTPGHIGGDDPELANRWIQFSDFSPFTRNHGASPRDVWSWGPEVEENSRFSRMLRYRLLPYIYTYCWIIYEEAIPLTRPLKFAYPGQKDHIRYQYLFGEEFLVSPVYQTRDYFPNQQMDVYLPHGEEWIDYWTHEIYQGGQTIKVDVSKANDKYIPLFVKRGAIVPMGPEIFFIKEEKHPNPLTLDIYPLKEGTSTFTLYDDDGKSMEYQNGKFSQTQFNCTANPQKITIKIGKTVGDYFGKPISQDYIIKVNILHKNITFVANNNLTLTRISNYTDLLPEKATPNTWALDDVNNILYVRISTFVNQTNKIKCLSEHYIPILKKISITPSSLVLELNKIQQFQAIGLDQYSNILKNFSPIWSASGGNITPQGFFTGNELGFFKIIAKQDDVVAETTIEVSKTPIISGKQYRIFAKHSGKVLSVSNSSTINGTEIIQFANQNLSSQKWKINDIGDSFYTLEAKCSRQVVEVAGGVSLAQGGRVQQWKFEDENRQIWRIKELLGGFYEIINVNSGKCLSVANSSLEDGSPVVQLGYNEEDSQKWLLEFIDDDFKEESFLI